MNLVHNNAGLHVLWESIEEFDKDAPAIIAKYNPSVYQTAVLRHHTERNWYGGCTDANQAMRRIRDGWPEMLARLQGMFGDDKPRLELAASTVQVRRRKRKRADYGDTLDIHRVWSGELDKAWERPEREFRISASQRHATIFIDVATTCAENADNVLWRAAAALLICDLLITTGRAVEIYIGTSGTETFSDISWFWSGMRLKAYTQPLHMERLAAAVTATFFRTYGFAMICAVPHRAYSYMSTIQNQGMPVQLEERATNGELVVRIGHCDTMAGAEREFFKVRDALAKEVACTA
jgi:hypothetical protein